LVRETIDDAPGHRIAIRLGEHERRQLDDTALVDPAEVDRLGQLTGRRQAEMPRYRMLQHRGRATAVLAPGSRGDGRHPDIVATTPIARDRAQREKPCMPPVRGDSGAVDAGAADDGDAPP